LQRGGAMPWRIFYPSEPAWETGDGRAKLEGSQGCSNLVPAWYLVGGCTPAHVKASRCSFLAWGWAVENGGWCEKKLAMEDQQWIRLKTTFPPTTDWSPQERGAIQLWLPTSRFLSSASRVYISAKIASEKLNMYKLNYIFVTLIFDINTLKTSSS